MEKAAINYLIHEGKNGDQPKSAFIDLSLLVGFHLDHQLYVRRALLARAAEASARFASRKPLNSSLDGELEDGNVGCVGGTESIPTDRVADGAVALEEAKACGASVIEAPEDRRPLRLRLREGWPAVVPEAVAGCVG